ncbi:OLC1v1029115C7 [Oldenlandia corymbosa var. corymbosa]|nr:OLC1v1029115C7 [Oldenlandia corymbosa var. corymbosa]
MEERERQRRLLERERLHMEQIRQLDFEELQVEEVGDDDDYSSDHDREHNHRNSGGASASGEFTYDTSLAALHSYLGDVEDTHNRLAFLDGGALLNLPMLYLEGVVLFPEATLPLRVIHVHFIAAVERALSQVVAPYTIGVVRLYRDPHNGRVRFANVGCTAEIRQYRRLEDGSVNVVTRGQQRFRLQRRWIDGDGATCGEVQIIQEDSPLRTPQEAVGRLSPLSSCQSRVLRAHSLESPRARCSGDCDGNESEAMSEDSFESELSPREKRLHHSVLHSSFDTIYESGSGDDAKLDSQVEVRQDSSLANLLGPLEGDEGRTALSGNHLFKRMKQKYALAQMREVPRAFWPNWVYRMYDSYTLAQKAADRWKHIVKAPNMDGFVMKPDLLSFHIASKIPVSESRRQELLEIDGISYRLRREIELLEGFDRIRCRTCETLIARRSDMLVMSSEGPLGAYVNPHGFVHEVMTLYKVTGLAVLGTPVKEHSWFPG